MPTFITGATGLIGNKLAKNLADRGEIVHALCRKSADIRTLSHQNIRIFYGDITDIESVFKAIKECDSAYHLAAYARGYAKDKDLYYKINVSGTENVCTAALKNNVKKIVFTSTVVTFGPTGKQPQDETTSRNNNIFYTTYEHSKYLGEKIVDNFIQKGLNAIIVNPTRVFGPGLLNESNSVTIMIDMYLKGKMRTILGDGNAIGNYGFVDDVVEGHILAMEKGRIGEKYILGGENVTYNQFFDILSEVANKRFYQFKIPYIVALSFAGIEKIRAKLFNSYPLITPEWVRTFKLDWSYSCKKAEKELGYKITPLKTALKITIDWLNNKCGVKI
ncbi:MAG: Dihydroflavonol-4-reductase [Ignavibacteriae bacterium]|nr:MAG: Dihydroflavonol-4-reductase [Ignavibacteriota bacterium]